MSKFSKALGTAVASTAINKFVQGSSTKGALTVGGITGVSTYLTDTVSSFIPQLRGMFAFAGAYAEDVISSLISTILVGAYAAYSTGAAYTDILLDFRGFLMQFLYSLGATVIGGYSAPMISGVTGM